MSASDSPIAVLGAGNWGTTLAHLIAQNGHHVRLFTRTAEQAHEINHEHTNRYSVSGLRLHDGITASPHAATVLEGAPLVVMATISSGVRVQRKKQADLFFSHFAASG